MERDAAEFCEASYEQDVAQSDKPDDIIRDAVAAVIKRLGVPQNKNELVALCKASALEILRGLRQSGKLAALMPNSEQNDTMLLRSILLEVINANDPGMMAHCAAFALDLGIIDQSQTQIAKRFGVTRATVSYVCRNLVETYRNGTPARAMKSPDAVRKYARLRKGKCAKEAAAPWEFENTFREAFSRATL